MIDEEGLTAIKRDGSDYFLQFRRRTAPHFTKLGEPARTAWHLLAGLTIGLGIWYLHWRWTASLNPEAMVFSIAVAGAETAAFFGTILFFFDIWDEADTPQKPAPETRLQAGLGGDGPIIVDIFITTFDEGVTVLRPTLADARKVNLPPGVRSRLFVLDDGQQNGMAALAESYGAQYLSRDSNRGFKAGNLRNAMMQTDGDFVVICDADTCLMPRFLENTMGYFRDPKVAWVQTPHWFYDIPEGQVPRGRSYITKVLSPVFRRLSPGIRIGSDPFLSDPTVFFDIIQRRRNRHAASFCCGAGSIHRREAVFENALSRYVKETYKFGFDTPSVATLRAVELQPFCYHVSEDILTSIQQHSNGWKSVYHPQAEARMLSPWSIDAWATQRLKYAGGTFDIMLRFNPILRSGMPFLTRLHYAATFWSYLAVLWLPILLLAPVASLFSGTAPIQAYSIDFFLHLVPLLLVNELAIGIGCKGYDTHSGRALAISALPIQIRAAWQVIRGQRPRFPTTPKTPGRHRDWRHAKPAILALLLMVSAAIWGVVATATGLEGYSHALLTVNLFWLAWNCLALLRVLRMSFWLPPLPRAKSENPACAGVFKQLTS